jgi:hypothetical protein
MDWETASEFHWPRFKDVFGKHEFLILVWLWLFYVERRTWQ